MHINRLWCHIIRLFECVSVWVGLPLCVCVFVCVGVRVSDSKVRLKYTRTQRHRHIFSMKRYKVRKRGNSPFAKNEKRDNSPFRFIISPLSPFRPGLYGRLRGHFVQKGPKKHSHIFYKKLIFQEKTIYDK